MKLSSPSKFFTQLSITPSTFSTSSFFIELFSTLQIIHLIVNCMSYSSLNSQFIIYSLNKNLPYLTGAFQLHSSSVYNSLLLPIWILSAIYFVVHVVLFMLCLRPIILKKKEPSAIIGPLSRLYTLHSRIIFFPLQYFLLNLIYLYYESDPYTLTKFYAKIGWLLGTIFLIILNTVLALLKEWLIYKINFTKNYNDIKRNGYHQAILGQKILCSALACVGQADNMTAIHASCILHLGLAIILFITLYIRIPFYNFKMLKFIITMTSIQLSLAFTAVIFIFTKDFQVSGAMHILVLILPAMIIKIAFSEFRSLFLRILRSQFLLPEHSIHYSLLLEQLLIDEKVSIIKDQALFPSKESMIGALAADKNIFVNENNTTIEALPLYQHIVEKLEQVHHENPKCWVLSLYLSQLHLEKLDNKARAMEMVRKLEDLNLFLPTKSSIEYVFSMIGDKHMKENFSAEDAFGLSSYFKYYELTNNIKQDMLEETKTHLRIWEDLHRNKLEVKRLVDRAESIDCLFNKIQRQYKLNSNNFRKNFTSPILLYSVYLNNVRETQVEGFQVLKSFQLLMNNQSANNDFDTISGTTALLIVSLDKAKAGQILDASGSIQSLFNYRKAALVGQKLGIIFPSMIAKEFQRFFNDFCKAPSSDLDYRDRTYAKTHTDEIFEIEILFKLYPYTNKEMTVLILLKKLSDPLPALIADSDGMIVDCSKMLKKEFQKENVDFSVFRSLKSMNTDLEEVNNAFNIGYNRKENKTLSLRGSIKEKSGGGSAAVSAAQSYYESEDITTTRYSNRSLIRKSYIGMDKIREDLFPTKQASQYEVEKAQQLCEGYIQGKKLRLWVNRFSDKRKERFSVHAQIKPLVCDENNVYKVMILGDLKKDEEMSDDYTEESARELSVETFADEFPMTNEKVHLHALSYNVQKSKRHERSSGRITTIISSRKEPKKKKPKTSQKKLKQIFNVDLKFDRMTPRDDQRSSAMSSAYQENKIVKTIKNIGIKKRLNSSLFWLHIALYLIIIFLLCLAGTKYNLSTDSINEIKTGIYIINTASLRLLNAINTWQWSLVLWAALGPNSFELLTPAVRDGAHNMSYYNDELKRQMFSVHNKDLQSRAFRDDVKLYQLEIENYDNLMTTNTFIATDILSGRYIEVSKATNIIDLVNIPDFFEIYNNTGNDYIIASNALTSDINDIIQERISKDISLLKGVLAIEAVFLVSIIALFILMAWIISRSYYRLCRTIARTEDLYILQRIDLLHRTRDYLEDDIERKSFIQDSFDSFINQKPNKDHAKESTRTSITYRTKEFDMRDMNKFLLKRALLALVFMPVLIGLFIGTLAKSINTFYSLASVNDQISILSEGCYQTNVAMAHQIYAILFQNFDGMLLNNDIPFAEASKTLERLNNLNTQLIDIFLTQPEEVDPLIKDILQTSTCDYIDAESMVLCYESTDGQKMGLLSLNTDYYNTLFGIKVALGNNTTYGALIILLSTVLGKVIGEMKAFEEIYPYLISHVLGKFTKTTNSSKSEELAFFIVILVLITVYAAFIFWKPLKDLRKTDIGRRKIIKIIPLHIMQENKGFKFYLMQDFKKEIDDFRSII